MIRRSCWFAFFAALSCCQASRAASQEEPAPSEEAYSINAQATFVSQQHDAFSARYSGANSLFPGFERKNSLSATLFLGARLWRGAEIYADPEVIKGRGLSSVLGIAGFPNGDVARVGDGNWKLYHARLFLRQSFGLGGEPESIAAETHQLSGVQDSRRVVISVGNFSAADFFDD